MLQRRDEFAGHQGRQCAGRACAIDRKYIRLGQSFGTTFAHQLAMQLTVGRVLNVGPVAEVDYAVVV